MLIHSPVCKPLFQGTAEAPLPLPQSLCPQCKNASSGHKLCSLPCCQNVQLIQLTDWSIHIAATQSVGSSDFLSVTDPTLFLYIRTEKKFSIISIYKNWSVASSPQTKTVYSPKCISNFQSIEFNSLWGRIGGESHSVIEFRSVPGFWSQPCY